MWSMLVALMALRSLLARRNKLWFGLPYVMSYRRMLTMVCHSLSHDITSCDITPSHGRPPEPGSRAAVRGVVLSACSIGFCSMIQHSSLF